MKILGIFQIDWLIKILIEAIVKLVDGLAKGEELNDNAKRGVRLGYVLACDFGEKLANDTDNEWDNQAVKEFKDLCIDTAKEGGFPLPSVPPL